MRRLSRRHLHKRCGLARHSGCKWMSWCQSLSTFEKAILGDISWVTTFFYCFWFCFGCAFKTLLFECCASMERHCFLCSSVFTDTSPQSFNSQDTLHQVGTAGFWHLSPSQQFTLPLWTNRVISGAQKHTLIYSIVETLMSWRIFVSRVWWSASQLSNTTSLHPIGLDLESWSQDKGHGRTWWLLMLLHPCVCSLNRVQFHTAVALTVRCWNNLYSYRYCGRRHLLNWKSIWRHCQMWGQFAFDVPAWTEESFIRQVGRGTVWYENHLLYTYIYKCIKHIQAFPKLERALKLSPSGR